MKLIVLLITFIFPLFSQAQQLYPVPQVINLTGDITYRGVRSADPSLAPFITKDGLGVQEKKNKSIVNEGYSIDISKNKIEIAYSTLRGRYSAYKTLIQVLVEAEQQAPLAAYCRSAGYCFLRHCRRILWKTMDS